MSLTSFRDTIMEIAEEMAKESEEIRNGSFAVQTVDTSGILKSYSRQLRVACKAVGEETAPAMPMMQNPLSHMYNMPPQAQHAIEVEKAKAEFRKNKKTVDIEESFDEERAEVHGGPVNPDGSLIYHPIPPGMPEGMWLSLAGAMYRLDRDAHKRIFVYDEERTKRAVEQMKEQQEPQEAPKRIITSENEHASLSWKEAAKRIRTGD